MPVTPAKAVTDRTKSSVKLQATKEQVPTVAAALAERFPAPVRPAAKAAIVLLCGLFIDWLARMTDAMVAADTAHCAEQGDDTAVRALRDAPAAEVHTVLVDLRDVVIACFGEAIPRTIGLEGALSDDPVVLHRAGAAAVTALRAFTPPAARRRSLKFDAKEWIELLEKPVAALGQALTAVAADQRQNQLTLGAKNESIAAYDLAFRGTANVLTGLFAAAGRADLADRVRPSTRRPGQTEEDAPQISGEPQPPAQAVA